MNKALIILLLFASSCSSGQNHNNINDTIMDSMTLQYNPEQDEVKYKPSHKIGKVLGSGTGNISVDGLEGKVQWTISEDVGDFCETSIYGTITSDNNDVLHFETKGYGKVKNPKTNKDVWNMPAIILFKTESEGISSFNGKTYFLQGTFDMSSGKHEYTLISTNK